MSRMQSKSIGFLARAAVAAVVMSAACASAAVAHEGSRKRLPKTKAAADLKAARRGLDSAKAKLAASGGYSCCVKPSCDMCLRTRGACTCAADVAAGKGACGECHAAWKGGRGAMKGITADDVKLRPTCHAEAADAAPPDAAEARAALDRAKRTLVSESRYTCCMKGGCDVCAHEGDCPCGADLAADLAPPEPGTKRPKRARGVCGECLDAWHCDGGAFAGVAPGEVALADMASLAMRTPAGGPYRSHSALGSGTSLVPASSALHALNFSAGSWLGMLHGDLKVGFNRQFGTLGAGKLESQNWLMVMAERETGPGTLTLRGMLSAEPLTAPHGGFRQLFQTGETYRGRPIYDAQHPHDLFMELSALYTLPLGERSALQVYLAPVGEPALGPSAYMHRPSASENPSAPLGHHGQDSTHITHGVVTVGLQARQFKLEASAFHGREPDERRAGIEMGAIDSWSARLWYAPTRDLTMQVSAGRMNDAETAHPGDIVRVTASVHHNYAWEDGDVASALVWGRDHEPGFADLNNYLFESTIRFRSRNYAYTRLELADKGNLIPQRFVPAVIRFKSAAALADAAYKLRHPGDLPDGGPIPGGFIPIPTKLTFRIGAYTVGYVRDVYDDGRFAVGLGADVTVHTRPGILDGRYGEHPVGTHFFVRVRPSANRQ
jgi:hypothetical protein